LGAGQYNGEGIEMGIGNEVCVMGMGYVGLTLAVAMSKKGYAVHGVEIDEKKLKLMKRGKPHFYELGLESAMRTMIDKGSLTFSREIPSRPYPVYIITVGTPATKDTKIPRLDMIERVSREISNVMDQNSLVILRSTVVVGATRNVVLPILKQKIESPQVAFCSERTLEGKALEEIFTLPQVIGAIDERSLRRASSIFHRITPTVIEVSSLETAEIIKLLDNVYRDTQFALANEVAEICEILEINGNEAIRFTNLGYDRTNIALPGYVGGPCLGKDPHILAYSLKNYEFKPTIIMNARALHEKLEGRIADRILRWALNNNLEPQKIKVTLLGMAFKGIPETDDLRGAPSITMIKELKTRGFKNICGHDYLVSDENIKKLKIKPVDITDAFNDASIVIFMNNNTSYNKIDLIDAIRRMSKPAYFMDSWNMFDFESFPPDGEVYYGSIGRR
jgi:UDP-N-acetyl-D-mannosaminuronic acid dehydrogenase